MNDTDIIINKVEQSGILTLNLENYLPSQEIESIDFKKYLFMEMILKEKDFRAEVENTDWSVYQDQIVLIHCSNDALIPLWAYMILSSSLQPYVKELHICTLEKYTENAILKNIEAIDAQEYADKRVVIKGCGEKQIPASAFAQITSKLLPVVKSLMYGEACSAVPVYKKKK